MPRQHKALKLISSLAFMQPISSDKKHGVLIFVALKLLFSALYPRFGSFLTAMYPLRKIDRTGTSQKVQAILYIQGVVRGRHLA